MASEAINTRRGRMIVAREKQGRRYLDASTDEAWAKSALVLLSERFREGYWYEDSAANPSEWALKRRAEREELLGMSEELLASLPAGVQEDMRREQRGARRDAEWESEQKQQYEMIKAVVERQDLGFVGEGRGARPKAWVLLEKRSSYEYEGVRLQAMEIAAAEIESIEID